MKNMKKAAQKAKQRRQGESAVIYVRVSSAEQVAGTSLDVQERQCEQYCKENNLGVLRVFREEGASAKTTDRPALLGALDFCRSNTGKIDAFVIWKVDRLARNAGDHFAIRGQLKNCGVTLHSATEQIGDDATTKLAETIYAGFAEFDNEIRKLRAINGMRARIKSGIWPFKAPVGYRCLGLRRQGIKKTEPDQPDPQVFPILQRVLKGYANGLYTQKEICEELRKSDFEALSGTKPIKQFVDRLLTEENLHFYSGMLRDAFGDEYQFYPGKHEPMITRDEMERIVRLRNGGPRARIARIRQNPDFPLRRIALCGSCRAPLTGSNTKGRKHRYAYYHCYNKQCSMRGKGIPKKDIEDQFRVLASELVPKDQFMDVLTESLSVYWKEQITAHKASQEAHSATLRELRAKKVRVCEMAENGAYTASEARQRLDKISADIAKEELELSSVTTEELDVSEISRKAREALAYAMINMLELEPNLRARFQKVAFPEGIPYIRETGFGTAKTARIFELNHEYATSESLMVRREGFEPS